MPSPALTHNSDLPKYLAVQLADAADRQNAANSAQKIDAHRPAPPADAPLPREPASDDHEDNAERTIGDLCALEPQQPRIQTAESKASQDQITGIGSHATLLPSILCGLQMGNHVADTRGPRRR